MTRKLHFVIPFVLLLKFNLVLYMPFKSFNKTWKNVGPKSFCSTKPTSFEFCSSNFNLQDHILNTVGDDLRNQFPKGQQNLIKFWKQGKKRNFSKREVFFLFIWFVLFFLNSNRGIFSCILVLFHFFPPTFFHVFSSKDSFSFWKN